MDSLLKYNKTIITAIVAIAILSGIIRIISYKAGYYMLLTTVIAYFVYRLFYFTVAIIKYKHLSKIDKQHFAIFIALLSIAIFNNFNLLDAPFISILFLIIDFLISLQSPVKTNTSENDQ